MEDDVSTGKTLANIQPVIESLNPEKVDLYFCGIRADFSVGQTSENGYFDEVLTEKDFGSDNIVRKIFAVRDKLVKLGY